MHGGNSHQTRDALAWFEQGRQSGQLLAEARQQQATLEHIRATCDLILTKVSAPPKPEGEWRKLWREMKEALAFLGLAWKVFRMVPWGALIGLVAVIWHFIKPYVQWLGIVFSR